MTDTLSVDEADDSSRAALAKTFAVDGTEATIVATPDAPSTGPGRALVTLAQGDAVGRYVTLSKLGAGGMGGVYAACDPELDRKVALKLVLPGAGGGRRGSEGHTRLLREAQALARLSHPNVVAVHDVGAVGERVWIAMEFVEGMTLDAWARARPRSWRAVVDVMRRAGEGLAAAHAAELLHRDFKPENVMVDADDRPRVMDFGLARARDDADADDNGLATLTGSDTAQTGALSVKLTRAGAIMGTPAYMAPEQFGRGAVTAASDQFAYCVTLWELLFGERPFSGDSIVELSLAVCAGTLRPPPRGRRVPPWLRRVCERGLSVEPERRFASMRALLDAMTTGQRSARARRAVAAAGLVALAGVSAEGLRRYGEARQFDDCQAEGAAIHRAWTDDARTGVRAALTATGAGNADITTEKTLAGLDAYANSWGAARVDACLDAEVRALWSADTLARARWCLDARRMAFESLVAELSSADINVAQRAVTAVTGLSPVDPCRESSLLARIEVPPSERRDELREVLSRVSRSDALRLTGDYARGLTEAEAAATRARELSWVPLVAAATARVGILQGELGEYDAATTQLRDAYLEATVAGAADVAALAATELVYYAGTKSARHTEGVLWSRLARVELTRLGVDEADLRRATLAHRLGRLYHSTGEYPKSEDRYRAAIAIWTTTLGREHPTVAAGMNDLASLHQAAGAYPASRKLHEEALAILETTLGSEHPRYATGLTGLANITQLLGDQAKATALSERALAIVESTLGPRHPRVAEAESTLAASDFKKGEFVKAQERFTRALSIWREVHGEQHPRVASMIENIALADSERGRDHEAKAGFQRALAIREDLLGPDHPSIANALLGLAGAHDSLSEDEEAKALYQRAIKIQTKGLGPTHPSVARTIQNLGIIYYKTGELDEALEHFQRSLEIKEKAYGPEHRTVLLTLNNAASVTQKLGRQEEARALFERVLRLREASLGADHVDVAYTLKSLAELALDDKRVEDAIALAERSVTIRERGEARAIHLAASRFMLAQALWARNKRGDRARARALAAQAVQGFYEDENLEKDAARWLRARGGPPS